MLHFKSSKNLNGRECVILASFTRHRIPVRKVYQKVHPNFSSQVIKGKRSRFVDWGAKKIAVKGPKDKKSYDLRNGVVFEWAEME
ncbi:hypothetical protein Tco_0516176 [Tanacetum coccineum]